MAVMVGLQTSNFLCRKTLYLVTCHVWNTVFQYPVLAEFQYKLKSEYALPASCWSSKVPSAAEHAHFCGLTIPMPFHNIVDHL